MTDRRFQLPDLGEGLADAEITSWHVAAGDTVRLNQVIVEVETAKASIELPSPYTGRVLSLDVAEGEVVPVGTTIITFAVDTATASVPTAPVKDPVPGSVPVPMLVGYGATAGLTSRRTGRSRPRLPPASAAAAVPVPGAALAKPLVRKLARELGIDLDTLTGTGVGGVINRQDVLDHAAARAAGSAQRPAAPPAPVPREHVSPEQVSTAPHPERERRIPIRGLRRSTAAAMVASAFTAPHVTEFITVDVTETMNLLRRLRAGTFLDGVKLTITAFVATAMIRALRTYPELNASWDDEAQEIVVKRYVNLGIATTTPRGLLVPNLKNAEGMNLIAIAQALESLATTARAGDVGPADLTGGTITLTNIGMFGVDSGTPILNPGEAAILCLGAVREQPWAHDGQLAVRWVTTLSLSFDHRVVDGDRGSRFLADIAGTLQTG